MAIIKTLREADIAAKLQMPGPVAVDFYQASCAPCRVLEPRLERVAEWYKERLPVYRVDVEHDLRVAEHFGVRSTRTVLILKRGKEIDRLDGHITENDLSNAFERAMRD